MMRRQNATDKMQKEKHPLSESESDHMVSGFDEDRDYHRTSQSIRLGSVKATTRRGPFVAKGKMLEMQIYGFGFRTWSSPNRSRL